MEFYVNITSIAIVSHISSFYEACTTEGFGNTKNKTVLFTDGVTWYFFEKNEKALEENKAEMFELGIRIIDEKKFDHIKWNESEKRYNDLKEKIKALCES